MEESICTPLLLYYMLSDSGLDIYMARYEFPWNLETTKETTVPQNACWGLEAPVIVWRISNNLHLAWYYGICRGIGWRKWSIWMFLGQSTEYFPRQALCSPSKHGTLMMCWFNVGTSSATMGQHWTNTSSMSRVCWENTAVRDGTHTNLDTRDWAMPPFSCGIWSQRLGSIFNKQETLNKCWLYAGEPSATLAQH